MQKQGDQGATKKQRDPDFVGAEIALRRAAERVRQRAAETGSAVVVFRDGKVVWEKADGTYSDEIADSRKKRAMKCRIDGCPGEYEAKKIIHPVRHHGQVKVIDRVPADICSVCGDVLLRPDTVRKIEALLQNKNQPVSTVPLYEFA